MSSFRRRLSTLAVLGAGLAGTVRGQAERPAAGGIVAGPDRNLWFTESVANRIGRITLNGDITEFPIPSPGSGPFGHRGRARWQPLVHRAAAGKIGRITTAGVVTEFALAAGEQEPGSLSIVAGPDGNLWFTEARGARIGRITTGGRRSPSSRPRRSTRPAASLSGPDGNLWFTDSYRSHEDRPDDDERRRHRILHHRFRLLLSRRSTSPSVRTATSGSFRRRQEASAE